MKYVAGGIVILVLVLTALWLRGAPERTMEIPSETTGLESTTGTAPTQNTAPIPATNKVTTINNMKIEVIQEGNGEEVKNGQTAVVHYVGKLTDGTIFDASERRGEPFEFQLGAGMVIKGWDQGVLGMKVGEKRILTIPSELGYGERGAGNVIPPNATLIFEVTLVGIK